MKDVKGFSLIEVLIAVAITAMIAVSAFAIMNQALNTQKSGEVTDQRLAQIQRAMNRISIDFQQVAKRNVRDAYGDFKPAVMGDKSADATFISLTRQGKRNPANLPRTELERITYKLEDKVLIREQWAVLDIATEDQILQRPLLEKVIRFEVEFYSQEQWVEQWPETDMLSDKNQEMPFPKAVKMTLELEDYGELIQIYPLEFSS